MSYNHAKMRIFGNPDGETLAQLYEVQKDAEHVALMGDAHVGYYMPIGGVAAYDNKICPAGVGYDIACGNYAVCTELRLDDLNDDVLQQWGEAIFDEISFGLKQGMMNPASDAPSSHPLFDDPRWDLIPKEFRSKAKAKARNQLGTIGSGNHYIDILVDEEERIWVGVHFGSRGTGHGIAQAFMRIASGGTWDTGKVKENGSFLDLDDTSGQDYYDLMQLMGNYAYAGRDWVVNKVQRIIGSDHQLDNVHNHHNFAWEELHFGKHLIVIRKGATPAWPGQQGFVGGSLGDNAVILQGAEYGDVDNIPEEVVTMMQEAMFSTVHGAGRVMSRGRAKREIPPDEVAAWIARCGVKVFGGGLDEAPQAYRRLDEVLKAQGPTVEILHTLKPLVVCMAGRGH